MLELGGILTDLDRLLPLLGLPGVHGGYDLLLDRVVLLLPLQTVAAANIWSASSLFLRPQSGLLGRRSLLALQV